MYAIVLDCRDSNQLADFYAALLGWQKDTRNPEWIGVSVPGESPFLLFQQVADYMPPVWPDEPEQQRQMVHIDFAVNDVEQAIEHALNCGATQAPIQYSPHWTVMLDPAGHPFCLCHRNM